MACWPRVVRPAAAARSGLFLFAQLADGGAVMLDRLMRVLRAPASTLTQRNIVNDASQSGRRNPSTTLRDESGSRFDGRLIAVEAV